MNRSQPSRCFRVSGGFCFDLKFDDLLLSFFQHYHDIDSTTRSAARSMPHSVATPGVAKLIDSTSKPCSACSAIHIITAVICCGLMRMRQGESRVIIQGSSSSLPMGRVATRMSHSSCSNFKAWPFFHGPTSVFWYSPRPGLKDLSSRNCFIPSRRPPDSSSQLSASWARMR